MFKYNGVHSWLLEYIHKCKIGEIVIGQELMQMLDILLTHFVNSNIRFEMEEAHKRIKFIQSECKHYEAPFAGKPFILMLFQKAFVEALYSFKIFDDEVGHWIRLYQEYLLLIGRKNGKTPFVSAQDLAEFFCGPLGIKILCSSNDYEQADLMFQAINAMREESPKVEKVTRKNIKGIFFGNPKNKKMVGKFSYKNKGSIRKISAKTGAKEGRNIAVGSVDEIHEMKDNTATMPIRQSLSTQDEPIYGEITTEGIVNDGYLDERLKEARQVLTGELERPRWLIWLYTQDSETEIWQDEKTWTKSNPGLGTIKKWSFLRQMIAEAQTSKKTRVFVLSKDFNIKQNNATAWLTTEDINNAETFDIEDFRNCFAIGSVDLSKTGDLASARALLMKPGSSKKYMVQKYFIPQSKLDNLSEKERKKYEGWIKDRHVTVSDGNENDFRHVTAWFVKLYKDYGIRFFKVGYDKWSAVYWVKEMEDYGFDCVRVNQDWGSMSEPMNLVEKDLQSDLINYNDNPIDKMCLENTALSMNSKAETMPVKVQSKDENKIDGAVTIIIAYRIYIDNRTEYLDLVKRTAA
ncbi:MAG TPA: terminase TerL endonuclease subunit [Ruminiclostridium sp.]